jgi:hypothetical protein
MQAKTINNLTLQITQKFGKIRNAGATKRTSVEEEKLPTVGPWFAPPTFGYERARLFGKLGKRIIGLECESKSTFGFVTRRMSG